MSQYELKNVDDLQLNGTTRSDIPGWMAAAPDRTVICCCGRLSKKSFVEKTLMELARFSEDTLQSETIARYPGLLQRLDPRVKVLTLGAALLAACTLQHPLSIAILLAASLLLAAASGAPMRGFVAAILVIPAFTALTALPAALNWITPGHAVFGLSRGSPGAHYGLFYRALPLAFTREGLQSVLILVLRTAASLSLTALLTLTTQWPALLRSLRIFGVPKLFLFVVAMVYRYLFLLLQTSTEMFAARKSRALAESGGRDGRQFLAATASSLFARSVALSDDVYSAMRSRGYQGEPRVMGTWRFTALDGAWLVSWALLLAGLWQGDHLHG